MLTFALYVFTLFFLVMCGGVACAIGYMLLEARELYKERKKIEKRVRDVINQ